MRTRQFKEGKNVTGNRGVPFFIRVCTRECSLLEENSSFLSMSIFSNKLQTRDRMSIAGPIKLESDDIIHKELPNQHPEW